MPTHEAPVLGCRSLAFTAKERQLDFTSVVMRGAGHEMPPKYAAMIGQWTLGERLLEPEAWKGNHRGAHEVVYATDLAIRPDRQNHKVPAAPHRAAPIKLASGLMLQSHAPRNEPVVTTQSRIR